MTSPLRRAREEVAVNIAVTGFVSKLLPTETKNLAREMEVLQGTVNKQRGTNKQLQDQHRNAVRQFGEASAEAQNYAQQLNLGKRRVDELNETIKEQRTQLRGLSTANADALNKIRGFGIALGVSFLTLGAFGAAAVTVAGNIRGLEAIAFRTGTTLAFLQSSTRRYTAIFGDADFAERATQGLADLYQQINLIGTGLSTINLGQLAIAGLNPSELVGLTPDALRGRLLQIIRGAGDDPRTRAALQSAVGGNLFDALSGEADSPAATLTAPVLTGEQQGVLRGIRRDFGEFRVTLITTSEILTVAVAPAMRAVFRVINAGISPIFSFIAGNQTLAKILGFVAVAFFGTIAAVSAFALVVYTATIIKNAFGISIARVTALVNFFRNANYSATAATVVWNVAGAIDIVILKARTAALIISGAALKIWTFLLGLATTASAGFRLGLVRNNILLIRFNSFVGLSNARVVAWNVGMIAARGVLKAKAGALLLLSLVMKGWTLITTVATAVQSAWNVALTANPIGLVIVAIVALVAGIGAAIFFIVKFRSQIWNFFQGWGQAIFLVLGPLGLLIIAIINVIKYWDKIKSSFGAVKDFFGFGGGESTTASSIPYSGGRGGGAVNVREDVTQYNTYNITGETNPERIADDVEERQNRNLRSNVSSRSQRFGLQGT